MHELRVTVEEFKKLFDKDADPKERVKIHKKLKLMCVDYPVIVERLKLIEEKFEKAQLLAGKYTQMKKNLKLNNTK